MSCTYAISALAEFSIINLNCLINPKRALLSNGNKSILMRKFITRGSARQFRSSLKNLVLWETLNYKSTKILSNYNEEMQKLQQEITRIEMRRNCKMCKIIIICLRIVPTLSALLNFWNQHRFLSVSAWYRSFAWEASVYDALDVVRKYTQFDDPNQSLLMANAIRHRHTS